MDIATFNEPLKDNAVVAGLFHRSYGSNHPPVVRIKTLQLELAAVASVIAHTIRKLKRLDQSLTVDTIQIFVFSAVCNTLPRD